MRAEGEGVTTDASRLRIGLLTASLDWRGGGVSAAVWELAQALSATHAAKVHLFGLTRDAQELDRLEHPDFERSSSRMVGPQAIGFSPQMPLLLKRADLDVLHLHGLWMYPSIALHAWRNHSRRPTVLSPHGMLDSWALNNSSWKKRLARMLFEDRNLQRASCIHALTVSEARAVRTLGFRAPIAVIPNGVKIPASAGRSAREASESDDRRVLLYLGRIHPKKGLKQAIEAWRLALDRAPTIAARWRLAIAGWDDGGHAMELNRLIDELSLREHVSLIGPAFDARKDAVLRSADGFILPSFSEGLPISVLEAWAYALPVFMTREANLEEGFSANAAIRIETRPQELARTLVEFLPQAERLREIGRNGRSLAQSKFSWEKVAEMYLELYQWLSRSTPRPPFVVCE